MKFDRLVALHPRDGRVRWDSDSIGILPRSLPVIYSDGSLYIVAADAIYKLGGDDSKKVVAKGRDLSEVRLLGIDKEGIIYLSQYEGAFLAAMKPDGSVLWSLEWREYPHDTWQLAIGPDGTIYGASEYAIFALGKPVVSPFDNIQGQILFSRRPPGHQGAYLYVTNPDGTAMRRILPTRMNEAGIVAVSPDGSAMAFFEEEFDWRTQKSLYQIRITAIAGEQHSELPLPSLPMGLYGSEVDRVVEGFAWSPDGTKLAFGFLPRSGPPGVYLVSTDGSKITSIPVSERGFGLRIAWSPDSSEIVITAIGRREAQIVSVDGTKRRTITFDNSLGIGGVAWSPDGRKMLLSTDDAILLGEPTGGKTVNLTKGLKGHFGRASWSPDGTKIAFEVGFSEKELWPQQIAVMTAGGGDILELTNSGFNNLIAWVSSEQTATGLSARPYILRVKRVAHGSAETVTLDLEEQYLPVVVASENPNAPYESLKAQAVASRSFALYKKLVEPRSKDYDVLDSDADQVYNPKKLDELPASKQEEIRKAIKETEGIVLKYAGRVICAFFVSGTGATQRYITFNQGKTGDDIAQTSLGLVTSPPSKNPYNRGAMGQVQANELASKGYSWQQILK